MATILRGNIVRLHSAENPEQCVDVDINEVYDMAALIKVAAEHFNDAKISGIYSEAGEEIWQIDEMSNHDDIYCSNQMELKDNDIDMTIFGMVDSGKSSLIEQYINYELGEERVDPLQHDNHYKDIQFDGREIILDIQDTAESGEMYVNIIPEFIRTIKHGLMFVFDIMNKQSFEWIDDVYMECIEYYNSMDMKMIPMVLVGNKYDLMNGFLNNEKELVMIVNVWYDGKMLEDVLTVISGYCEYVTNRKVGYKEGVKKAEEMGAIGYIETSAKSEYNVGNAFGLLVREMIKNKFNEQVGKKRRSIFPKRKSKKDEGNDHVDVMVKEVGQKGCNCVLL